MSTLMELISTANDLEEKLFAAGGDLTPELESALDLSAEQIKSKIDGYAMVKKAIESRRDFATRRMMEWSAVVDRCENADAYLTGKLKTALGSLDTPEVHGFEFTAKLQMNPGKVVVVDESMIPGDFIVTETKTSIDKKLILETLKAGVDVPGAMLMRDSRVVIKTSQRKVGGNV